MPSLVGHVGQSSYSPSAGLSIPIAGQHSLNDNQFTLAAWIRPNYVTRLGKIIKFGTLGINPISTV